MKKKALLIFENNFFVYSPILLSTYFVHQADIRKPVIFIPIVHLFSDN